MIKLILISALSFAEDGSTEPPKTEAGQEQVETEAPPKEKAPKAEESRVDVIVHLRNGMQLEGTASLDSVLNWNVGQPIGLMLAGATQENLIPADKILAIKSPSDTGTSAPTDDNIAVYPTVPASPQGYAYPNAAPTRYLYAPSSIGLQKGQGYISQKLAFTSVAYAPSDNVTLLFGTFTFFPPALTVVGGKYARPINDKVSFSVGGEVFIVGFDSNNRLPVAIGYVGTTWGDTDQNITISTGFARDSQLLSTSGQVLPVMIAGQKRFHQRFSVVSENWVFTDLSVNTKDNIHLAGGVGSLSLRMLGRRDTLERLRASKTTQDGYPRSTWDIGFLVLVDSLDSYMYDYRTDELVSGVTREYMVYGPLPWVDYTWHFGPVRR